MASGVDVHVAPSCPGAGGMGRGMQMMPLAMMPQQYTVGNFRVPHQRVRPLELSQARRPQQQRQGKQQQQEKQPETRVTQDISVSPSPTVERYVEHTKVAMEGPVGGRPSHCVEFWQSITSDRSLVDMVSGLQLDFIESQAPCSSVRNSQATSLQCQEASN